MAISIKHGWQRLGQWLQRGALVANSLRMLVEQSLGSTNLALVTQDRFLTDKLSKELGNNLNAKTASVLEVRGQATRGDDSRWAKSY